MASQCNGIVNAFCGACGAVASPRQPCAREPTSFSRKCVPPGSASLGPQTELRTAFTFTRLPPAASGELPERRLSIGGGGTVSLGALLSRTPDNEAFVKHVWSRG